jgi:hypothetical protein
MVVLSRRKEFMMREYNLRQIKLIIKIFSSILVLFSFPFSSVTTSQIDYNISIYSVTQLEEDAVEFDVVIRSIDENLVLTSYQCAFFVSMDLKDASRLSFKYIDGTSQLTNTPDLAVGVSNIDKKSELTFASWSGMDTITQSPLRIGRFRFQYEGDRTGDSVSVKWDFNGDVSTILTGESFRNITNCGNHTYNYKPRNELGKNASKTITPEKFRLFPNHPNPFNSSTKIKYSVPSASNLSAHYVHIKVYDILGNEIAILVSEEKLPGLYEVEFNRTTLSSGIFFCELKVNDKHIETIKMILLR